jgi:hypothetical protein
MVNIFQYFSSGAISVVKILRVLRVLRPLRAINRHATLIVIKIKILQTLIYISSKSNKKKLLHALGAVSLVTLKSVAMYWQSTPRSNKKNYLYYLYIGVKSHGRGITKSLLIIKIN